MRKINDIIRKVSFESFFQGASHHNARKYRKHPIWEYKTTLKNEYFECFFKPLPYENGETHRKQPLRTNRITTKQWILIAFELLTNKNTKMYVRYSKLGTVTILPETSITSFCASQVPEHVKTLYIEKQNNITKSVCFRVFFIFLCTKHQKSMQSI